MYFVYICTHAVRTRFRVAALLKLLTHLPVDVLCESPVPLKTVRKRAGEIQLEVPEYTDMPLRVALLRLGRKLRV